MREQIVCGCVCVHIPDPLVGLVFHPFLVLDAFFLLIPH